MTTAAPQPANENLWVLVVFHDNDWLEREFEPAVTVCSSYSEAISTLRGSFPEELDEDYGAENAPDDDDLLAWLRGGGVYATITEPYPPMAELRRTPLPPHLPRSPELEDVDVIPDQAHEWGRSWDSGYCDGRVCNVCGDTSDCRNCNRAAFDDVDCLRVQAEDRNYERTREHKRALERYAAQMDYYLQITGGTAT